MADTLNGPRPLADNRDAGWVHTPWLSWGLLGAQAGLYAWLAILSRHFEYNSGYPHRPIPLVLLLLAAAFVLHLLSVRLALRSRACAALTRRILFGAVLFRLILLPSLPIQEIDIYRYLWDGAVVAAGGNPYQASPQQVLTAATNNQAQSALSPLVMLKNGSAACEEALQRIHYGELITVYPPVSQAVFGLAAKIVPADASLYQRLVTMKIVLTLFDVLTAWAVIAILRSVGHHAGWAMLYAWSPLVCKEFANSGHLDSIAVCLTTTAVLCLLQGRTHHRTRSMQPWSLTSALLLGLGVGAKLYPLVLIPVLALWTCRLRGMQTGAVYAIVSLICAAGSLSPMFLTEPVAIKAAPRSSSETPLSAESTPAPSGLATFLSRWEINDLLFLVTVENLRPDSVDTRPHWFVIAPNSWRTSTAQALSHTLQRPIPQATFLTARAITLLIFAAIVAGLLWRASCVNTDDVWLRTVFLTVAWFWALAPTLNPWYWTWALPFLPFAGRRAWTAVSLLVLIYYGRFWLMYHLPNAELLSTGYRGEDFFHYVLAPLEHGAWLLWLSVEALRGSPQKLDRGS